MNNPERICPVCDSGHLQEATHSNEFFYNGSTVHVNGLENYICDECGSDPVFPDQIKRNQKRIADAKRTSEGLLTGSQIFNARESFGLTQKQASVTFGGGLNAFSKYERGDVVQSVPMDRLLRLCIKYPYLIYDLATMASQELGSESLPSVDGGHDDYRDSGRVANDHYIFSNANKYCEMTVVELSDYRSRAA